MLGKINSFVDKKFNRVEPERMRYQRNTLSFWFCMLGLVLAALQFSHVFTTVTRPTFFLGLDVMLNIFIMLAVFWGSAQVKAYKLRWTIVLYVVALVQLARIFFTPLYFMVQGSYPIGGFVLSIVYLVLCAFSLAMAAIINSQRSKKLNTYLQSIGEQM